MFYTPKILIVDDDKEVLEMLVMDLQAEYGGQYDIEKFSKTNLIEAQLEKYVSAGVKVALIISDQRMPDNTGMEFFAKIKSKIPVTKKVILTGYSDIDDAINAFNKGDIHQFLTKPWTPAKEKLIPLLNKLLHDFWRETNEKERSEEEQNRIKELTIITGFLAHEFRNSLFPAKAGLTKILGLKKASYSKEIEEVLDAFYSELTTLISENVGGKLIIIKEKFNKLCEFVKEKLRSLDLLVHQAHASVQESLDIITKIMTYNKLENNLKYDIFNIDELLSEVYKNYIPTFEEKQIKSSLNLKAGADVFLGKDHIKQVLNNLIINSIEAMQNKMEINIISSLIEYSGTLYAEVCIQDTGIGIKESDKKKIFTIFHTTKPDHKGAGIGLSFCKKIIELYGGKIIFESKENMGTTFKIYLPVKR